MKEDDIMKLVVGELIYTSPMNKKSMCLQRNIAAGTREKSSYSQFHLYAPEQSTATQY